MRYHGSQDSTSTPRRSQMFHRRVPASLAMLAALCMLLIGCGGAGASYGGSSAQANMPKTPSPGSPALNGCALQHPPTGHQPPANIILTDGTLSPTPVTGPTLLPTTVSAGVATPVATTYANTTPATTGGVGVSGTAIVATPGGQATVPPPFDQQVKARVGQTIEVRLRASVVWSLTQAGAQALAAQNTKSWYDAAHQACVWQFVAAHAGVTHLTFTGGLVCPHDQPCPVVAAIQMFDVVVR